MNSARLMLVALAAVACSGSPAAKPTPEPTVAPTAAPTAAPTPAPTAAPTATTAPTPAPLAALPAACLEIGRPLLDALADLDSRLHEGLNFTDYSRYAGDITVIAADVTAQRMTAFGVSCAQFAVQLLTAELAYIDAHDIWLDCDNDSHCDRDANTTDLQKQWRKASEAIRLANAMVEQSTSTYAIAIEAEPNSNGVSLTGTTNLPDGAVITLSASRAFRNRGEGDIRAISADHYDVTVTAGAFTGLLALDESDLLVLVGTGPGESIIDQIDSGVTVCADFETGTGFDGTPRQPPSVVALIGANGEAIATSPQVYIFGSATSNPAYWLEVKVDVPLVSGQIDGLTAQQGSTPDEAQLDGFCFI